jgi:hypothetical protein
VQKFSPHSSSRTEQLNKNRGNVDCRLREFENRELRRIFGPNRDEATGEWRRLHNEELNDLYSSPKIFRVIKSKRMRWAGHVACMGEKERCIQNFGRET